MSTLTDFDMQLALALSAALCVLRCRLCARRDDNAAILCHIPKPPNQIHRSSYQYRRIARRGFLISLKLHPTLNERWVQELIATDPGILGLGDLVLRDKERIQPRAGRLDLLLGPEIQQILHRPVEGRPGV
jgi:hypothetical protein